MLLQRYSSDEGNEERQQMAFFLALFLARQKKIFLRKEVKKVSAKYSVYEEPISEEFFTLKQFDPLAVNVEQIQEKIAQELREEESHDRDTVSHLSENHSEG